MKLLELEIESELPGLRVQVGPSIKVRTVGVRSNWAVQIMIFLLFPDRFSDCLLGKPNIPRLGRNPWPEIIFFMEYEMNLPRDVISKFALVIVISFCNWDHFTSLMFSENLNLFFFNFSKFLFITLESILNRLKLVFAWASVLTEIGRNLNFGKFSPKSIQD